MERDQDASASWDLVVYVGDGLWGRRRGGQVLERFDWWRGWRELLALSPDGRRILLGHRPWTDFPDPHDPARWYLTLVELADGSTRDLSELPQETWRGSFSPDSRVLAVVSTEIEWHTGDRDDDSLEDTGWVVLSLLDLDDGSLREVWRTEGGHSQETTVAWSPAGTELAVTWLDYDEEEDDVVFATTVVDLTGRELASTVDDVVMFPTHDGAWDPAGTLHVEIPCYPYPGTIDLWGPPAPDTSALNDRGRLLSWTAAGDGLVHSSDPERNRALHVFRPDGTWVREVVTLPPDRDTTRALTTPDFTG